jgi:triphosphoribosyl-dephospho-CoA synthase
VPTSECIQQAFRTACLAELTALKPGNVHIYADGHDMDVNHFKAAAEAAAPHIANRHLSIGERVLNSVDASIRAANCNTNLGILLLTAPLAKAAETIDQHGNLQTALKSALRSLTPADTSAVYTAIAHANPGGLGTAQTGDVRDGPGTLSLLEAMRLSAEIDRIAKAYTTDFEDLFDHHLDVLTAARKRAPSNTEPAAAIAPPEAITTLYMTLLADFPDSHVARKFGTETAAQVRAEAKATRPYWHPIAPSPAPKELLALDAKFKANGLNPGTTADFVVATLFADQIRA